MKLEKLCGVLQAETAGLRNKVGVEKDVAVVEAENELQEFQGTELTEADKEITITRLTNFILSFAVTMSHIVE